jgi:hypothetical protein
MHLLRRMVPGLRPLPGTSGLHVRPWLALGARVHGLDVPPAAACHAHAAGTACTPPWRSFATWRPPHGAACRCVEVEQRGYAQCHHGPLSALMLSAVHPVTLYTLTQPSNAHQYQQELCGA